VGNPLIFRNGATAVFAGDTPGTRSNNNVSRNGQDGVHLARPGRAGQPRAAELHRHGQQQQRRRGGGRRCAPDHDRRRGSGQGNRLAGDNNGVRLPGRPPRRHPDHRQLPRRTRPGPRSPSASWPCEASRLLTVEGNFFEKLDADGASLKAHLDASTTYNFRRNSSSPVKLGTGLTFEEGLTLNLDYSGNVHLDNELALRVVESTGEIG
jgi:hypothetical protein